MKNCVLLHINYNGSDQKTYRSVSYDIWDKLGHKSETQEFATGDPCRDWSHAIHEALSKDLPVLRADTCDQFINCGSDYVWGTSPGKKLVLERAPSEAMM